MPLDPIGVQKMLLLDSEVLETSPDIDDSFFRWNYETSESENESKYNKHYSVLRHKIYSSPIVQSIYRLKYNTSKESAGLESENSESDGSLLTAKMQKELQQKNPDTYDMEMDDFDLEDEMLKYTSAGEKPNPLEIDVEEDFEPDLDEIFITVQQNSIKINNQSTFELPSSIRATELLKGIKVRDFDEDSLLVSLSSGYLLLIRFYMNDDVIKPYVVQWWKLENHHNGLPRLTDTGRSIISHDSGLGFVVTATQGLVRLFYCGQTQHGAMIDRPYNISFDGTILHTCFLKTLKDSTSDGHAFIFSLVVTSHGRYLIKLVEWWIEESRINEHTPMVLVNNFGVPVMIIPLLDAVLLVMEERIVVVKLCQILSADYSFYSAPFPGAFPVSHYKPSSTIMSEDIDNEVLISSEDGEIYSVIWDSKALKIEPVLKVPKLSKFSLEKVNNGYQLIYSSDKGSGSYVFLKDLELQKKVEEKNVFNESERLESWSNWAPVFDVEIVDTKDKVQELWLAHGKKISRLTYGLLSEKRIRDHKLRKAYKVFHHIAQDELYFIFAFIDKTLVFKYDQDELIAISDSGLDLIKRTVHFTSIQGICFQITEDSIIVSNFETSQILKEEIENDVILADCYVNFAAIITDSVEDDTTFLTIYEASGTIKEVQKLKLFFQPNFVKFLNHNEQLYVLVASSDKIHIYSLTETGIIEVSTCDLSISQPHDLVAINDMVYVSSRYGEYTIFDVSTLEGKLVLKEKITRKISNCPIDFFLTESFILLISKSIWKLDFNAFSVPIPIMFQELRSRSIFSAIALNESTLAVLRSDGFAITTLSNTQEPILNSIKIGQVPKKIKYISHLNVFAIITETSLLFCNKLNKLEEVLYSKRKSSTLFDDELPLSLAEWVLPTSEKSYRNLLVGCYSNNSGSVKILQPKMNPENPSIVEVYELFNIKTDGPVLATQQLDPSTVLYSSGYKLYTSVYDLQQKRMLDPVCVHTFYSIIMGIEVRGDDILVSTKDSSVIKLHRSTSSFVVVEEDPVSRKATSSLLLDSNITITTDKLHCTISGIQDQNNKFITYVPFVPKLKECQFLPTWYQGEPILRFLSYGFGGDIHLYTLLNEKQTSELQKYYEWSSKGMKNNEKVTQKGFWEINDGPWRDGRDINLFDSDGFRLDNETKDVETLRELLLSVLI